MESEEQTSFLFSACSLSAPPIPSPTPHLFSPTLPMFTRNLALAASRGISRLGKKVSPPASDPARDLFSQLQRPRFLSGGGPEPPKERTGSGEDTGSALSGAGGWRVPRCSVSCLLCPVVPFRPPSFFLIPVRPSERANAKIIRKIIILKIISPEKFPTPFCLCPRLRPT